MVISQRKLLGLAFMLRCGMISFLCCSLLSSLVWVNRHTLLNVGAIPPKGLIARLTIRKGIRWPGFLGEQPLR